MDKNFGQSDPKLAEYVERVFQPQDLALLGAVELARRENLPEIQVGAADGLHLEVLTRAVGARKAVEVGTLFGYSGICIARGLPDDGKLYTLEVDSKHARVARACFEMAGVTSKVELLVGPGLEGLEKLRSHGPFDLLFIDADKVNYPNYLAWAAENLRVGGVVIADNTFGFGMIADEKIDDPEEREMVEALRKFNEMAAQSGRFRSTLLPTGEGLTICVKVR